MMEYIRYFILLQALFSFFIAGGLFFRELNLKSTTMALLMAMFGTHMLIFIYGSGAMATMYPKFTGWFYYEIAFLFGPVMFVHLQTLIFYKKQILLIDLLHLVPVILFWIGYGDVLLMEGSERRSYVIENFLTRTMTWNYILAIQLSLYAVSNLAMVVAFKERINRKQFVYSVLLAGFYITATAIVAWLTWFADRWRDFSAYYLVISLLVFTVGFLMYCDPSFFKAIRKKYFTSSLDSLAIIGIQKKVVAAFDRDRIYLQNDLSIMALAKYIAEKHYHVSQTFSEGFRENFNDYVNKHRVDYARMLLKDPQYDHLKIEAIALESGFNNKVTFYKAFTKFMNETPSKYRKAFAT